MSKSLPQPNTITAMIENVRTQDLKIRIAGSKKTIANILESRQYTGCTVNYMTSYKSIKEEQEFYHCSQYKEKRGTCTIHYIRDVVLKENGVAQMGYTASCFPTFL